ncbi:MAG: hypothetical protein GY941_19665 [Planctomycetes bacterium]|nr:hypothetical protein [Planctomycetota bacterium]
MRDTELMKEAWQALLNSDLKKRDEIVGRLTRRNEAREKENIKLAEDAKPYFTEQ